MPGITLWFRVFWGILEQKVAVSVVCSCIFSEHWLKTLREKKNPQCLQCLCFFGVHLIIISAWALHTALPLFSSWQDCYNVLKILIILFTLFTGLEKQILLLCLLEEKAPPHVCACVCVCVPPIVPSGHNKLLMPVPLKRQLIQLPSCWINTNVFFF